MHGAPAEADFPFAICCGGEKENEKKWNGAVARQLQSLLDASELTATACAVMLEGGETKKKPADTVTRKTIINKMPVLEKNNIIYLFLNCRSPLWCHTIHLWLIIMSPMIVMMPQALLCPAEWWNCNVVTTTTTNIFTYTVYMYECRYRYTHAHPRTTV